MDMDSSVVSENGETTQDRRQQERVPGRVEVRFTDGTQAARALKAYSMNMSVGGLCLRTRRRYEVGARLSLSLGVGASSWQLQGSVAWVRDGAVGVRFENVSEEDRRRLEALVATLRG